MIRITLAFAAISLAFLLSPEAQAFEGRVVGVSDGDTVTVLDASRVQYIIRLDAIDAPEKSQEFGNRSKQNLSALVFGKIVEIPDSGKDKYGRTVSRVLVGQLDAGLEQIRAGYAWHYKKYAAGQSPINRVKYSAAETDAQANKMGMWQLATIVRPDIYRQQLKQTASVAIPSQDCPCSSGNKCTGPKGGTFCVSDFGLKKYSKN